MDEFQQIQSIKSRIEAFIGQGHLTEAKTLLDQLEGKLPEDSDVCSMQAVIHIMEGKLDESESVLQDGLKKDSVQFDLVFNLAYINELREQYQAAADLYSKAGTVAVAQEQKINVRQALERILTIDKTVIIKNKLKMIFFVKLGLDNFLGDIIRGFSDEYCTRKMIITDFGQIDDGMDWADICWFEWCDELVAHGSKLDIARKRKIICRLHSYEAFTDYPSQVNWSCVDRLVFVSQYIRDYVSANFNVNKEITAVIPNGVDIGQWTFKKRSPGYRIAYVGHINYKKGPMLLLHTFKAIFDRDNRYVLHIAGQCQDNRYALYFRQMVKELGLENNFFFDGWQKDLDSWLNDKNYILCSSLLESQNMSVMQAMAKGLKPVIHNFAGASEVYPERYLWNTISDAVGMVTGPSYDAQEYRNFIIENYLFEDQLEKAQELVKNLVEIKEKNVEFDYKGYWNNRLINKFDLEGVGHNGLGTLYNSYLYSIRFEMLKYFEKVLFGDFNGKDILELGPGIGVFTDYFNQKGPGSYMGIDISEKAVEELKKKYSKFKFIEGDISENNLYNENQYDLIFAADVLLHLVDERKYKSVIGSISHALRDNGIFIMFDPITVLDIKSISPHVVIRDIKYINDILSLYGLGIAGFLPSAFFMNHPFDCNLLGAKSDFAEVTFSTIQTIFGDEKITNAAKHKLAEWLTAVEKQCLIVNGFGLSQKMIIIKKNSNPISLANISIKNIWDVKRIAGEAAKARMQAIADQELKRLGIIDSLDEAISQYLNWDVNK